MKHKNLFIKIYIPFVIVTIIALIVLQILGSKKRIGYLTDFNLNIERTLLLNDLTNINESFIIDGKLDEESIKNYLLTNENITNYVYQFRIRYYDKIFRNSDIYGVYPNLSGLPDYMENAEMEEGGSPYGNFISDRKTIETEKIDNVSYTLKLKYKAFLILPLYFLILLIYFIIVNIKKIDFKSLISYIKINYKKLYGIFTLIFIILIIILYLLGNLNHKGTLEDFELIAESPAGYVYRAKVVSKGFFSPNFIYEYSDKPLKLESKPDYIKNYGYALEINRVPDWYDKYNGGYTWNNEVGSFSISNSNEWNWYGYEYRLNLSKGEVYRITSEMKTTVNMDKTSYGNNTFINLDDYNNFIGLYPTNDKIIYYTNSSQYLLYSNQIQIYDLPYKKDNILSFNFPKYELNIKYIKIFQVGENLYVKDNKFIIFTSLNNDIQNKNILDIYYKLQLNNYIYLFLLIIIIPILIYKAKNIIVNDTIFTIITFILVLSIAVFHYWLCFPGIFFNWDMWTSMKEGINAQYNNFNPVFYAFILNKLYALFGYYTHYLFSINVFLFYCGLFIIIISLYYKFKCKYVILLLLIPFIPNLFFMIINHLKDFVATYNIWLSYSIIFCICIANIKNKRISLLLKILSVLFLIIGMLCRHNFIVLVYPIFILFTYNILKKYDIKNKIKYFTIFISIMVIFAFGLIFIYKIFPKIIIKDYKMVAMVTPIKILQIAACSVPTDDDSLIPKEWYKQGKQFEDLKMAYYNNPFNSDIFISGQSPLKDAKSIKLVNIVWIKYIIKYPIGYIKHIFNFAKHLWSVPIYDKVNVYNTQYHLFKHYEYVNYFDNTGIVFTPIRAKIYSHLDRNLYELKIVYFIILSIILFIISGLLWLFNSKFRVNILLFTFCSSFSAVAINIIVVLISPVPLYRYIYPVIPVTIISLISFITFIYDRGGFRKFIKELWRQ